VCYIKILMKKILDRQSRTKKIIWGVVIAIFVLFGLSLWYVNAMVPGGNVVEVFARKIPGSDNILAGEDKGRINIAVMGMRGIGVAGGGLLADTIMVISIIKNDDSGIVTGDVETSGSPYKISILSVPRDLLVEEKDGTFGKINATFFKGERQKLGGGIEAMKSTLSQIVGQPIHYGISVNFEGFSQIVDALGGVDVDLAQEFVEPLQFNEVHVCDGDKGGVFKVPTGETQKKFKSNGEISVEYPLCSNSAPECGGVFRVASGKSTLTGEDALCYVRSRMTSSDFDRSRRQQEVIAEIRSKVRDLNLITDLGKLNEILSIVGDNVMYDLELWELEKLFGIYKDLEEVNTQQFVLEDSEAGLLYAPEDTSRDEYGYVLRPRGENYDRVHQLFESFK